MTDQNSTAAAAEAQRRAAWEAAKAAFLASLWEIRRHYYAIDTEWNAYVAAHDQLIETPAPDAAAVLFKLASVNDWLAPDGGIRADMLEALDREAPRNYVSAGTARALAEAIELDLLKITY